MNAKKWAERLRIFSDDSSDNGPAQIPKYSALELASLLEAAEQMARALDEMCELTDTVQFASGCDHCQAQIDAGQAALAAWRGKQ